MTLDVSVVELHQWSIRPGQRAADKVSAPMSECQNPFGSDAPTLVHHGDLAIAQVLNEMREFGCQRATPNSLE